MKKLSGFLAILVLLPAMAWSGGNGANQQLQDLNSLYEEILLTYASPGEKNALPAKMVDYRSLADDERWDTLIDMLAEFPVNVLETADEKKAFYLNVYNILAMDMVTNNWPIRSLRNLGSVFRPVWTHEAGVVGGEPVTLRYLEHGVLRATGDPRIHMAINCASMSCPDLRNEPYKAEILDQQLNDQVTHFLAQENKGLTLDPDNKVVLASSIFDWFEEDFESEGGIAAFIRKYRDDIPESWDISADIPYNWDVNGHMTGRDLRNLRADW